MKDRLDVLLVKRDMFTSREKAKSAIMAGIVYVDGLKVDKAGTGTSDTAHIELRGKNNPYVGRGGFKLEKAIDVFSIDLQDAVAIDMGASTGGFTDCMLQRGASKVYAIDVGYGQLDYKLRIDPRVINIERCNIRTMDISIIEDEADLITIDVSFISLKLILPKAEALLKSDGKIVCLVKPQFEAGRDQIGKNGIVRDAEVHKQVLLQVISWGEELGLQVESMDFSPIRGGKGNIEYLLCFSREFVRIDIQGLIEKTVKNSGEKLE